MRCNTVVSRHVVWYVVFWLSWLDHVNINTTGLSWIQHQFYSNRAYLRDACPTGLNNSLGAHPLLSPGRASRMQSGCFHVWYVQFSSPNHSPENTKGHQMEGERRRRRGGGGVGGGGGGGGRRFQNRFSCLSCDSLGNGVRTDYCGTLDRLHADGGHQLEDKKAAFTTSNRAAVGLREQGPRF